MIKIDWKKKNFATQGKKFAIQALPAKKRRRLHSTKDIRMRIQIIFRAGEKYRNQNIIVF